MIFPEKHINFSESIFGLSHQLIKIIKKNENQIYLEDLWMEYENINDSKEFQAYHNFDNFILGINLLYLLNIINYSKGVIKI